MKKTGFWIALIGVILAYSLLPLLLLGGDGEGGVARVLVHGEELRTVDLASSATSFTVEGEDGGRNVVEVERGRIRVAEADCPDQVCVRQGWISDSATPIVCLPHGLVIEITGAGDGPDGAAG